MNSKVSSLIESYKEDYAAMLTRWVRVPSLKAAPQPNAPFGAELRRMLDMAMDDAKSLGFDQVRDIDGYACDITWGEGEEPIAVLGHLDVVPAGDGWQTDPFGGVREGDKIISRGTGDDKGPMLAALFALKAIKEAGIKLRRPVRVILGCDEESDWEDMAYYAAHADMPKVGFSPDASFPLINTEKAMLHFHLRGPLADTGLQVKSLWTGERMNVIPGYCEAVVAGDAATVAHVNTYAAETGLPYTAELTDEGVKLVAEGIPGHSAYPDGCRNAIGMMLLLLKELGVEGTLRTLADAYGMEHDGASLGCKCEDELSGPLTCNMGILHIENGIVFATLDNRVPVSADLDALEAATRAHLPGIEVETVERKAPHHVPAESELVSQLLAAYTEETGELAEPESTGGGTYAKVLEQGVAFGASFPDDPDLAHQAGEYIDLNKMVTAMKIYANAILRLCADKSAGEIVLDKLNDAKAILADAKNWGIADVAGGMFMVSAMKQSKMRDAAALIQEAGETLKAMPEKFSAIVTDDINLVTDDFLGRVDLLLSNPVADVKMLNRIKDAQEKLDAVIGKVKSAVEG